MEPGAAIADPISIPDDAVLARRLNVLMVARLVLALLGITAVLGVEAGVEQLPFDRWPVHSVLIAALAVNVVYLLIARVRAATGAGLSLPFQAYLQVVGDVVIVSALVYLTGILQVFIYLYFAAVIAAAMLTGARGGLVIASAATILLSAVSFLFGVAAEGVELPLISPARAEEIKLSAQVRFLFPYLISFGLSLHLVAALAGYLVGETRRLRILHEEVLQNLADGVLAVDRKGIVGFANAAAHELLGLPAGGRGRPAREILPPEVRRLVEEAIAGEVDRGGRLTLGGRPLEIAVNWLRAGGRRDPRGVLVMISDVSLRDQLVRVTATAERSRALLEMSASMAHEIRNPLASIRAAAGELADLPAATEDDRRLLSILVRESARLNKIISDFLEFAGTRRLEIALCDVSVVVREVGELLAAREEFRSGQVRVDVEAPAGMIARADADRLKQVVLNLGINALEAVGERGEVRLAVRRAAGRLQPHEGNGAAGGEGILIEVADTGPGIDPEHASRLFDPFFTTKPRGTGMGLAIARRIIKEHDGQIALENRGGGGALARVWLPV